AGAGRRLEDRRSRRPVPRRGWREEDGITRWGPRAVDVGAATIAGARNAGISARRAPGRLGRRMLQIWLVRSTNGR
ncbi:MAG: hypothetical protein WB682_13495, partial [Candidatus Dormiibacterota bacterium]